MSRAAALSHIRLLASLGLPGQTVMPSILAALHDLVGSDSNGFFWVDDSFELANICAERMLPPDVMQSYFREFYHAQSDGFRSNIVRLRAVGGVARKSPDRAYYRSDYYNTVMRQLDAHHVLYGLVTEGARTFGQISLYRANGDPAFDRRDERNLADALPYIGHALASAETLDQVRLHPTGTTGHILANRRGEVANMCATGRKLLFRAVHPDISPRALRASPTDRLPAVVLELVQHLERIATERAAPPPSVAIVNPWGRFTFRASWMDPYAASDAAIAITVRHEEPLQLVLLDAMRRYPLSAREKEAALLLADGSLYSSIGERMGVTLDGAKFHIRGVFNKLGISERTDLVQRLIGPTYQ